MKKIILYSSDPTVNLSLILYLKDKYYITTTTDRDDLEKMVKSNNYNAVLLDIEPSVEVENLCKNIKSMDWKIPIILIYVYKENKKEFDKNVRKYIDSIFYKPFDVKDMSRELSYITETNN